MPGEVQVDREPGGAVIHEWLYVHAHDRSDRAIGAFLNVTPNGVNVLKLLGLDGAVASAGTFIDGLTFHNHAGRQIGRLDSRTDLERYGARQVVIRRGDLNRVLHEAAMERGVDVLLGRRPDRSRQRRRSADGALRRRQSHVGVRRPRL